MHQQGLVVALLLVIRLSSEDLISDFETYMLYKAQIGVNMTSYVPCMKEWGPCHREILPISNTDISPGLLGTGNPYDASGQHLKFGVNDGNAINYIRSHRLADATYLFWMTNLEPIPSNGDRKPIITMTPHLRYFASQPGGTIYVNGENDPGFSIPNCLLMGQWVFIGLTIDSGPGNPCSTGYLTSSMMCNHTYGPGLCFTENLDLRLFIGQDGLNPRPAGKFGGGNYLTSHQLGVAHFQVWNATLTYNQVIIAQKMTDLFATFFSGCADGSAQLNATTLSGWSCDCLPGATAIPCVYVPSNCNPPCSHGTCDTSRQICQCESGWTGQACSEPVCTSPCSGMKPVCVAPNTCICAASNTLKDFFQPANCGKGFRIIQEDVFSKIIVKSVQECSTACYCTGDIFCRSFSYFENGSNSQCWLNIGHTNQLWEGLEKADGWIYYHAFVPGEAELCKVRTFHDCRQVERLGFGPGEYNFQTDINSKTLKAECEYVPSAAPGKLHYSWYIPSNNLSLVFFRRSSLESWTYGAMMYQDYKWGFGENNNKSYWLGLEWASRWTTGDFYIMAVKDYTYCAAVIKLNATHNTLMLIQITESTHNKCATFTFRNGRLQMAYRSTCPCKDPSSGIVVLCGCNSSPYLAKFYFHANGEGLINDQVNLPYSKGHFYWTFSNQLKANGTQLFAIMISSMKLDLFKFYAKPSSWTVILSAEESSNNYRNIHHQNAVIENEKNDYRLNYYTCGTNNAGYIPGNPISGGLFQEGFVAPDRPVNNYGWKGGFWMRDPASYAATNICLTCTLNSSVYRLQNGFPAIRSAIYLANVVNTAV